MIKRRFFGIVFLAFVMIGRAQDLTWKSYGPVLADNYGPISIASGEGRFVLAVTGTILYSDDAGQTWHDTHTWLPISSDLMFGHSAWIRYLNGKFFAGNGNSDGWLWISDDGIHWNTQHFEFAGGTPVVTDAAYGAGRWVLVGKGILASSTNAVNWEIHGGGLEPNQMVTYGNGQFLVMRHYNPQGETLTYSGEVLTSEDGLSWVGQTHAPIVYPDSANHDQGNYGLAFQNGKFFLLGAVRSPLGGDVLYIAESVDGMQWTVPGTAPAPASIAEGRYGFNQLSVVNGELSIPQVAYGNGFYVVAGVIDSSPTERIRLIQRGPSMDTLTNVTALRPTNYPASVAVNGSTIVMVGQGVTIYSTNNWQTVALAELPAGVTTLVSAAFAQGKFIAVGAGGAVIQSNDGAHWTKRLSNTTSDLNGVAYGNGIWVAAGAGGRIISSTDGNTFTLQNSGAGVDLTAVAYGDGRFVAVGKDRIAMRSTDGAAWTIVGTDPLTDLVGVAYGNGHYIALGANGTGQASADGALWQSFDAPISAVSKLVFAQGYFVALASTPSGDQNMQYASATGTNNWVAIGFDDLANQNSKAIGLGASGGKIWLAAGNSILWTLEPVEGNYLTTSTTASGQLKVRFNTPLGGAYDLLKASSLTVGDWQKVGTLTPPDQVEWISTDLGGQSAFFIVRQPQTE